MADDNVNVLGLQANDSLNDNSTNDNSTNVAVGIEDSLNDNSTNDNSTNVAVGIEDSLNDNSTNLDDSFNTDVEIEDSFNTDVEIEDSFNDNSTNTAVAVEIDDSFNVDNSVRNHDSFNVTSSFNTQTLNDFSTTVGVRQYNTGFGDFNLGGLFAGGKGAGGGGDVTIDNRALLNDQSVNQVINNSGLGGVNQLFGQSSVVAFGDGSVAAGDDVDIDNTSTNISVGDVNIGNTNVETYFQDSFNDFSTNTSWDVEVEIEDSFNDNSTNTAVDVDIEDSFTSEINQSFDNSWEWENSGNLFSPGGQVAGDDAIDVF